MAPNHLKCIENLPETIEIDYGRHKILFCHYAMADDSKKYKPILRDLSILKLNELYEDYRADCIVFGHDHHCFQFTGMNTFINPGSLGFSPGYFARYCVLTIKNGISYEMINLPYDKDKYFNDLAKSGFPNKNYVMCILNLRPNIPMEEAVRMMREALED